MKRYLIILLLMTGFLNFSNAQVFHRKEREKREGAEEYTKVKPHKQMYHFEKQEKDKKIAHNGSNYKKPENYKVDGNGFAAYVPVKEHKYVLFPDKSRRLKNKMKRMPYAVK
ncbi:MAG: hypothetical protein ACJ77K_01415 [Bacteroidia bacterium]